MPLMQSLLVWQVTGWSVCMELGTGLPSAYTESGRGSTSSWIQEYGGMCGPSSWNVSWLHEIELKMVKKRIEMFVWNRLRREMFARS